jgi:uncharacterized protein (DUF1499 family)
MARLHRSHDLLLRYRLALVIGFMGALMTTGAIAMNDQIDRLPPCPSSPNCVCSDDADSSSHYIEPLISRGADGSPGDYTQAQQLLAAVAEYMSEQREYSVSRFQDDELRAEATTRILKFVDDIQMQVRGDRIFVRSASRVGYSDLGKNRRRIEAIRQAMVDKGLAFPQGQTP